MCILNLSFDNAYQNGFHIRKMYNNQYQNHQSINVSSPGLSALTNSGSSASGVGGVSVGMGSGSMINTVVTGIGGTVMLPNSSSSSSSSSSTSSSNHLHMLNAGGATSQCTTNGSNSNNSVSLPQALLHPNSNSGMNGNGTTNLSGNSCGANVVGAGGPQQPSPQAPPTYVNL